MKRKMLSLAFILAALLFYVDAGAQTTLDVEIRPRTEFRQGFRKPLADTLQAAIATVQRTRFNADYRGKVLNARLSLQDTRVWGNSDMKSNPSKVDVYEAWFEYLMASGFSLQMGRQPLKYDDQRLLAAPSWSSVGIAHDIMVLKYQSPLVDIHGGFAMNNSKDTLLNVAYAYTAKQVYKNMGYLWAGRTFDNGITASAIGIAESFEKKSDPTTVYERITYGGNLFYANATSPWGAKLTGYAQTGKSPVKKVGNGYADLDAYFAAAKLSYQINKKVGANVGVDYYSGSASDIAADKSTSFNRLYGSVHSYNGSMEYFVTLPTQGLVDYYGGITASISPKLSLDLSAHLFYFDKTFVYNKVAQEKSLGSEADLLVNYAVNKEIAIQGGYSMYFNSSSTLKYFKMDGVDTKPQQWAYVMFTVKPQLYKTPVIENK
jgi:hypothetical protein